MMITRDDHLDIASLAVKKLSSNGRIPERASQGAAGYDVFSAIDGKVLARSKALIPTDIAVAIPQGFYGRIAPRSGLAVKHSIDVGGGVIDSDYRGNVGIVLFNHSDVDFTIKAGDRIAQMIIEPIAILPVMEMEELGDTVRGSKGFGSTGTGVIKK